MFTAPTNVAQIVAEATEYLQLLPVAEVRLLAARTKLGEGELLDIQENPQLMTFAIADRIRTAMNAILDGRIRDLIRDAVTGNHNTFDSLAALADMAGLDAGVCWNISEGGEITPFEREQLRAVLD